jgi:Polyketide cyclase / dehydrase and lipid transport
MKSTILIAACLGGAFLTGGSALAAPYTVIALDGDVDRPIEAVWPRISGWCDIGAWVKVSCAVTSGKSGEVGSVRRIAGSIDEVLVARTATSYTYAQPKSPIDYHGTLAAEALPGGKTRIHYTLVYDSAGFADAKALEADRTRRETQFRAILGIIRQIAGAP